MAPIVKRRPSESVSELESASPEPNRGDKRLRLSTAPPGSDDDESPAPADDNEDAFPIATQADFVQMRDQDSDDEGQRNETTKLDRMKRDMGRAMENTARENGIIEKVTCVNFMCHKHLTIELGPLINFIIGHNGSGKSAVLTAIQLCLGGKATSTNRGQNLKSFVKEGEENAELIVKIKNGGESSYRHEIYGDSIIVERHFSRNGPSSFKIKNVNGKIISTKRSELDDICDFYAFQLDNPVNVLTQDMARQFLNSSSQAEKYRFFIKGVQLEQLNNDYTLVWETLNATKAQLELVTETTNAKRRIAREARQKYNELNKQTELRSQRDKYHRQVAWVQVEQEEKKLEQEERNVRDADARIERARESFTTHEDAYAEANQAAEDANRNVGELQADMEPHAAKQEEAKAAFDKHKNELLKLQSDQRQVYSSLKSHKTAVERLQKEIQDERQRLEDADGGVNATKLAEIEEAERDLAEAKHKYEQHPREKPALEDDIKNAERRLKDAVDRKGEKQHQVDGASDRLKNLRNDRGNSRRGYHHTLANFERAVQSETRWHEKPVGPMGDYIQLMKPEWSSIVERVFGQSLAGFIVTSKHDEKLLSAIAKRTSYFGPIFVTRATPIDTSGHEPEQRFDTILRILKFDNDLVRNQAIIAQNVDQVILIKNMDSAQQIMFRSGQAPRNVKSAVCFNPGRRGWGIRLLGNENQKMDAIEAWNQAARLKTDIESQISMQEEAVRALKQELGEAEQLCRQAQENVKKCKQALRSHENKGHRLLAESQSAEDLVASLKADLEAAAPQDGKLDGLKDQLREAEEERDLFENQFEDSKAAKSKLDANAAGLMRAVEDANKAVEELQHKIAKAEKRKDKAADKRQLKLREKNEAEEAIKDAERHKRRSEQAKQEQVEEVESFTEKASEICARVPVDRGETWASLSKKYDRMNEQIHRAERELGGSREELTTRALEAKRDFEQSEKARMHLVNLEQIMTTSIRDRSWRWRKFRSQISSRARIQFIYLMSERGFDGKLRLDHKQKLLELQVQPDRSSRGRNGERGKGGQTTTLSGGEKSYSTICLLLALWDAMGSPIRCLDEFDVFMDSVNRNQSMKLMIKAARRSVGRQFILITPQAMDGGADADVKIHRMADPERGQTALNFGQ